MKIDLGKEIVVKATVPVTAENLQRYVIDRDLSVKEYKVRQGISKANLIDYYNDPEAEIENFKGGIEISVAEAQGLVPESFPNSAKPVMEDYTYEETVFVFDEETGEETEVVKTKTGQRVKVEIVSVDSGEVDEQGDPIMVTESRPVTTQKNWIEYCGLVGPNGKILKGTKTGGLLCEIGYRNSNGGKRVVSNAEFRRFADYWGIERVLTKSEVKSILSVSVSEEI